MQKEGLEVKLTGSDLHCPRCGNGENMHQKAPKVSEDDYVHIPFTCEACADEYGDDLILVIQQHEGTTSLFWLPFIRHFTKKSKLMQTTIQVDPKCPSFAKCEHLVTLNGVELGVMSGYRIALLFESHGLEPPSHFGEKG